MCLGIPTRYPAFLTEIISHIFAYGQQKSRLGTITHPFGKLSLNMNQFRPRFRIATMLAVTAAIAFILQIIAGKESSDLGIEYELIHSSSP